MRESRLLVSSIAIISKTSLFDGAVSATAQTSTTPLSAKSNAATVNARASNAKYVILRDDDIAPYSDLNTLKAVNQVTINESVPATLAITPHPDTSQNGNELLMDQPMLTYLRSLATNPLFELAQHGYNHQPNGVGASSLGGAYYQRPSVRAGEQAVSVAPGTSEFAGRPYADQYAAIKQGWDDINGALGVTPTTFVPPWNFGDANTLRAVHAVGHTLYSTAEFDLFFFIETQARKGDLSGVSVPAGITVQPVTFEIPWQAGADWNTAVPSLISQTDSALNSAPAGDTIVILYHFWSFERSDGSIDPAKIAWLQQYINDLKSRGDVVFTTLNNQQALPASAQTPVTLAASNKTPAIPVTINVH